MAWLLTLHYILHLRFDKSVLENITTCVPCAASLPVRFTLNCTVAVAVDLPI